MPTGFAFSGPGEWTVAQGVGEEGIDFQGYAPTKVEKSSIWPGTCSVAWKKEGKGAIALANRYDPK
jgi:hypothetical protein